MTVAWRLALLASLVLLACGRSGASPPYASSNGLGYYTAAAAATAAAASRAEMWVDAEAASSGGSETEMLFSSDDDDELTQDRTRRQWEAAAELNADQLREAEELLQVEGAVPERFNAGQLREVEERLAAEEAEELEWFNAGQLGGVEEPAEPAERDARRSSVTQRPSSPGPGQWTRQRGDFSGGGSSGRRPRTKGRVDAVDLDACHLNFGSMDGDPELADETYASLQPLYTETAAAQHEGGFAVLDDADADFIVPDDDARGGREREGRTGRIAAIHAVRPSTTPCRRER
jgi:hypothetical protein